MKIEPYWLNKTNMAASLGISPQAFTAWGVEPVAKIGREVFYVVGDVLANREGYWLSKAGEPDDPGAVQRRIDYELARTRLVEAQASHQELKNEIARHEVAPFRFISYTLGRVAGEIRGLHDSLPMECGRRLNLSLPDVEKIREMVAVVANRCADLADIDWLNRVLDDFNREEGLD